MRISASLPTGVAALLFDSARRLRGVERELVALLEGAGYGEVMLPILDYVEPYEALPAAGAARGEIYRFVDRDGELLALRSDFTPMLARLLAPRLASLALPLRLFYRGDVVRYEAQRPGHHRELYQVGAELLGESGEEAEREILALFLELAAAACVGSAASRPPGDRSPRGPSSPPGAGSCDLQVVLGFAGALDALLVAVDADDPVRLAAAVARRERGAVRGLPPAFLQIVEHGVPENADDLGPTGATLRRMAALRDAMAARFPGVALSLDLAEFAGCHLDPRLATGEGERPYYDGLVFRAYAGPSALPIGGGGRYDRLFAALGARVPAVGFSLSLDGLLEVQAGEAGAARAAKVGA